MPSNQEQKEIMAAIDQLIDRLEPEASLYVITVPTDDRLYSLSGHRGNPFTTAQSLVILLSQQPLLMKAFMTAMVAFESGGGLERILRSSEDLTEEVLKLSEP